MTVLFRVLVGLLLSLTGGIVASPSAVAHSALGQTKSANTISVSDAPTPLSLAHSALYSVRASTEAAASATMGNSASIESAGVAANTGGRLFWSGGDMAKGAAEFAENSGGKTLEMTRMGRSLCGLPKRRRTT